MDECTFNSERTGFEILIVHHLEITVRVNVYAIIQDKQKLWKMCKFKHNVFIHNFKCEMFK